MWCNLLHVVSLCFHLEEPPAGFQGFHDGTLDLPDEEPRSKWIDPCIDHPVRRHRNRNRICQEVEELQQLLLAGGWPLSKVPEHQALPRHAQLITRGHSIWISMYLIVISQSFPWISYIRKVKKRGFFVTSLSTAAFQIQLPGLWDSIVVVSILSKVGITSIGLQSSSNHRVEDPMGVRPCEVSKLCWDVGFYSHRKGRTISGRRPW